MTATTTEAAHTSRDVSGSSPPPHRTEPAPSRLPPPVKSQQRPSTGPGPVSPKKASPKPAAVLVDQSNSPPTASTPKPTKLLRPSTGPPATPSQTGAPRDALSSKGSPSSALPLARSSHTRQQPQPQKLQALAVPLAVSKAKPAAMSPTKKVQAGATTTRAKRKKTKRPTTAEPLSTAPPPSTATPANDGTAPSTVTEKSAISPPSSSSSLATATVEAAGLTSPPALPSPPSLSPRHTATQAITPANQPDDAHTARLIKRAQTARFYFLNQDGPRCFTIGNDTKKFKIYLRPFRCSVCRTPKCIHVYFVLLRVLRLQASDRTLRSDQLLDYEVTDIIRAYQQERQARIDAHRQANGTVAASTGHPENSRVVGGAVGDNNDEAGGDDEDDDEADCPICLLNLIEGESVSCCSCCHNAIHIHCLTVWRYHVRKDRKQSLLCPICRNPWEHVTPSKVEAKHRTSNFSIEGKATQAAREATVGVEDAHTLEARACPPFARPWLHALGAVTVSQILSSDWRNRWTSIASLANLQDKQSRQSAEGCAEQTHAHHSQQKQHEQRSLGIEAVQPATHLDGVRKDTISEGSLAVPDVTPHLLDVVIYACKDSVLKVWRSGLALLTALPNPMSHRTQLQAVIAHMAQRCHEAKKHILQQCSSTLSVLVTNERVPPQMIIAVLLKPPYNDLSLDPTSWQWLLGSAKLMAALASHYPYWFSAATTDDIEQFIAVRKTHKHAGVRKQALALEANLEVTALPLVNVHEITSVLAMDPYGAAPRQPSSQQGSTTLLNAAGGLVLNVPPRPKSSPASIAQLASGLMGRAGPILLSPPTAQHSSKKDSSSLSPLSRRRHHKAHGVVDSRDDEDAPCSLSDQEKDEPSPNHAHNHHRGDGPQVVNSRTPSSSALRHHIKQQRLRLLDQQRATDNADQELPDHQKQKQEQKQLSLDPSSQTSAPVSPPRRPILANSATNVQIFVSPADAKKLLLKQKKERSDEKEGAEQTAVAAPMDTSDSPVDSGHIPAAIMHDRKTVRFASPQKLTSFASPPRATQFSLHDDATMAQASPSRIARHSRYGDIKERPSRLSADSPQHAADAAARTSEENEELAAIDETQCWRTASYEHESEQQHHVQIEEHDDDEFELDDGDQGAFYLDDNSRSSCFVASVHDDDHLHVYEREGDADRLVLRSQSSERCEDGLLDATSDFDPLATSSHSATSPKPLLRHNEFGCAHGNACTCGDGSRTSTDSDKSYTPLSEPHSNVVDESMDEIDYAKFINKAIADHDAWRKGRLLGSGISGKVYETSHPSIDGSFAVKQIELASRSQKDVERLELEVDIMTSLPRHENLVKYFGMLTHDHVMHIYFELLPLGSLSSLLSHYNGPLPFDVVRSFTYDMTNGLAFLHNHGIAHRDMKPANLLLSAPTRLKLCDLGLAAQLEQTVTQSGELEGSVGTPVYMAPEVITSQSASRRSDCWSLGCCVLECLTGNRPWSEVKCANRFSLLFHIASPTSRPRIPHGDHIGSLCRAFLDACFERDVTARPCSLQLLTHEYLTCGDEEVERLMQAEAAPDS